MKEKHARGAGIFSGLAGGFLFMDWIRTGNMPSDSNAWFILRNRINILIWCNVHIG